MRLNWSVPYLCALSLLACETAAPPEPIGSAEPQRARYAPEEAQGEAPDPERAPPTPREPRVEYEWAPAPAYRPPPPSRPQRAPRRRPLRVAQTPPTPPPAPPPTPPTPEIDGLPLESAFVAVAEKPLSTFSVDVDTASYSRVRRLLNEGAAPPPGAVRVEEMINAFDYDYPQPSTDEPFAVYTETAPAPWAPEHTLLHVGLQGRSIEAGRLPPRNLVFLIDVSGSMDRADKLPLLKQSLMAMLGTLRRQDTVSIVVYAGASGVVLEPTPGHERRAIADALHGLSAFGSTNGGAGIELAYRLAERARRPGSVDRVILATDGDFNVGPSSREALVALIEQKRRTGVFLTVLGFGMGDLRDEHLERLADHGNGDYAYIDTIDEARKALITDGGARMVTIAQDVKLQIEMNPARVGAWRLIGYENRRLATRDFDDDRKDAGDIGAGHSVTALYELLTPAQAAALTPTTRLKYQPAPPVDPEAELATIKLRYKSPRGEASRLITLPVAGQVAQRPSETFRFSAAVAAFGMLLADSPYRGDASYDMVRGLALDALGADRGGHRAAFLDLVEKGRGIAPR